MTYCSKTLYSLLLIFAVSCDDVLCSDSPAAAAAAAEQNVVYRMPLMRRKSPLEMLLRDPSYAKKLNIRKTHPPTNENITLFKYLDSEYYAEILVGTPGKRFTVIFDTTWGDMWLPSKLCSKELSPVCDKKNLYDGNASSTHKMVDPAPFNVSGLVGNLTCDTVKLYHLNVTDLVFAEIRIFPDDSEYTTMHADGIIGLAFNSISQTTKNPFFYKLLADRKISKAIFSVYINRDPTTPKGGTIFLGGVEPKHYKGEMTYVPVTKKGYWEIEMNQFSVQLNKTNAMKFCRRPCRAVLDTSSNKIGVPAEDVVTVNNLIGAVEYMYKRFVVPCSKVKKLPTVTLSFGGKNFQIGGRHYIQKIENGTNGGMICMSAFCDAGMPDKQLWMLGGAFLSSVYTTFDLENGRVGIAESNN